MNNVTLIGRLTADPPEPATTAANSSVLDLRIAVNHPHRFTLFVNVTCWGPTAENASKYLHKGSLIGVSGELAQHEWTDKATGEPRSRYYILADRVEFLDHRLKQATAANGVEPTTAEVT